MLIHRIACRNEWRILVFYQQALMESAIAMTRGETTKIRVTDWKRIERGRGSACTRRSGPGDERGWEAGGPPPEPDAWRCKQPPALVKRKWCEFHVQGWWKRGYAYTVYLDDRMAVRLLDSMSAWQYTCMVVLLHDGFTVRRYDSSAVYHKCICVQTPSVQDARTPFLYIVAIIIYKKTEAMLVRPWVLYYFLPYLFTYLLIRVDLTWLERDYNWLNM